MPYNLLDQTSHFSFKKKPTFHIALLLCLFRKTSNINKWITSIIINFILIMCCHVSGKAGAMQDVKTNIYYFMGNVGTQKA